MIPLQLIGPLALALLCSTVFDACAQEGTPGAPVVHGRVASGGEPLPGVILSNGRDLTRSDAQGRYSLPAGPDIGRFIFVCCPRGHWTDDFHRPIDEAVRTGRADFELHAVQQPERFDFVFAADLADLGDPGQEVGYEKTKASLAEICGLAPRPAFLWIQGDLGIRPDGGERLLACLASATIPVRTGIGNHEVDPTAAHPKAAYERILGPTYYSFDWGPVHFVVLDGNAPTATIPGHAQGAVQAREWAWLEADLAAQPPGKPIIAGVHIPIVSTYPARRPDLAKTGGPFWLADNGARLTSLLARHGVRLVLQGHMHENERIVKDGVEYVSSVSLCGRWWKSGASFERATDGSPRGYRIVSVDGGAIRHRYRSCCESHVDRQGEFMGLRRRLSPREKTPFTFNAYDAPSASTAHARLDGGPWRAMEPVILPDSGLAKPHHWRLVVDTTQLAPGAHRIEARVTWPDGTVLRESASFEIGKASSNGKPDGRGGDLE